MKYGVLRVRVERVNKSSEHSKRIEQPAAATTTA